LAAHREINNDTPLLLANSDQYIHAPVSKFISDAIERNLDGSILTFVDAKRDPKWSFARLNDSGFVEEVKEKFPISDFATVGLYYFAKGSDFVSSAIDMIVANDRVNNELYTCPVYNYAISRGQKIGIYNIPENAMYGLGTPADLDLFLQSPACL
jgi:dTDP-glucose pyrophosphorylase